MSKVHIVLAELPTGTVAIGAYDDLEVANRHARAVHVYVNSLDRVSAEPFPFVGAPEQGNELTVQLSRHKLRKQRVAAANVVISKRTGKPKRKYTRRAFSRGKRK